MKTYTVTASLRNPSCYDAGATFEIEAQNKRDAIKEARKMVVREMLYDRNDGAINYAAEETEN